jgi:uncharacterized protein YbcI
VWEHLWVFLHAGFFLASVSATQFIHRLRQGCNHQRQPFMETPQTTMAQQIAQAASAFQQLRTGHAPKAVTVVLSDETLVITLHGALSPAEKTLAMTPAGAAQVQDFHRHLFASSAEPLREEIKRITGVDVREAAAEVEPSTGAVVQVFTSGTMVQVFQLAHGIATETWSGNGQPK